MTYFSLSIHSIFTIYSSEFNFLTVDPFKHYNRRNFFHQVGLGTIIVTKITKPHNLVFKVIEHWSQVLTNTCKKT